MSKGRYASSERVNVKLTTLLAAEMEEWREITDAASNADFIRDAMEYYILTLREVRDRKKQPGFRDETGKFEAIAHLSFVRLLLNSDRPG